ncbi:MAG: DEAD/DEAH box helicase family protein [Victivallales bacterium]|nr:DEAD/DEAH box helicase family protein [Victivallales bacterium]
MIKSKVEEFFGEHSPLKQARGDFHYEERPQQAQMAAAVAEAMDTCTNLCVEAPTGVGKTYAYLVPAVLYAKQQQKAVIISTHTINLQEQIIAHDIPRLEKMLNCDINAVVAKGKGNYLCLRRFYESIDTAQDLIAYDGTSGDLARLTKWAGLTKTGDFSEMKRQISPQLKSQICGEWGNCPGPKCDFYKSCHVQRAKRLIMNAEIIIANHAKFFSALALDEEKARQNGPLHDDEKALPDYCAVILDEGHTVEDAASNHLGFTTDSLAIKAILNKLYNPEKDTGVFAGAGCKVEQQMIREAKARVEAFFNSLDEWLSLPGNNEMPLCYTTPNHIPHWLESTFTGLISNLNHLKEQEQDEGHKAEINSAIEMLTEANATMSNFFAMSLPDHVYWFDRINQRTGDISLNIVPVDVSNVLQFFLYNKPPVIITSATLAVNGDISYFQRRIGFTNSTPLVLDSPFDYGRQVKMYIARSLPEPTRDGIVESYIPHLERFLTLTKGHAFVLFTSYSAMNRTAEKMEDFFRKKKMELLVQGDRLHPRQMLEDFRNSKNAVIFGTSSFWTGVDVPGDALINVIITKLPFSVPTHPLTKARCDRIERQGGNAFTDYSIPEAVLKFRQGFGRLIRTQEDQGIVVVLDSRIVTKRYGQAFLNSIPECPKEVF